MPAQAERLFLSYSRKDDEPFVKRLYDDLTARGFTIWWDRVSMPARGPTFTQEIRDAISNASRLIEVVGPSSILSEYVAAEWKWAVAECKVVIPVLRVGDYSLLPPELACFHCLDFRESRPYREALDELLRILNELVVPLGSLAGEFPSLPAFYQARPDDMLALSQRILADVRGPVVTSPQQRTSVLYGMGGVGKSVLCAAFAHECETRRAFTDGIVWVQLGQQPDLARAVKSAGQALGDDPNHYTEFGTSVARLRQVLQDRVCLLILDDVWKLSHAEVFVNALGPRTRALFSTRDAGIATTLGAQTHVLDTFTDRSAVEFLARWVGQACTNLPPEAAHIARQCGNLPLALAMVGAMLRENANRWQNVLYRFDVAELDRIQRDLPNYPYPNLMRAMAVSVDFLEPEARARYLDFAIFPEDVLVPESVLEMLWAPLGVNRYDAEDTLDLLVRRSLARRDDRGRVTLHDLQLDYLRLIAGDLPTRHNNLLDCYGARCSRGWPSLPDDGYSVVWLSHHLDNAGRREELRRLLLDPEWIRMKLAKKLTTELLADYRFVREDDDLKTIRDALQLSVHLLIKEPSLLTGQVVGRLMSFKSAVICTFVDSVRDTEFQTWLEPRSPSLVNPGGPLLRTLEGHRSAVSAVNVVAHGKIAVSASQDHTLKVWDLENGELLRTLEGHTDVVWQLASSADGHTAVSQSADGTLRIWDIDRGIDTHVLKGHGNNPLAMTPAGDFALQVSADHEINVVDVRKGVVIRVLMGHSAPVGAMALTADGKRAISASEDGTIRVWDLDRGTQLQTIEDPLVRGDPSRRIGAIAVSLDGTRMVSTSHNSLKVWDLSSGVGIRMLEGHTFWVSDVAITADGQRVVSASYDRTLKVWDLSSGHSIQTLEGHSDWVRTVALTPDGKVAISGSYDGTLKVWSLDGRTPTRTLDRFYSIAITPDGRRALSGASQTFDRTAKLWDLENEFRLQLLEGHASEVSAVAITPDAKRGVCAAQTELTFWDLDLCRVIHQVTGHTRQVRAVAMRADGRFVISGSEDSTLKLWDVESGLEVSTLVGDSQPISALAVTTDWRLAVSSAGGTLRLWEIRTGSCIRSADTGDNWIGTVAICRSGKRVVAGSSDGMLFFWDVDRSGRIEALRGHSDGIVHVAITESGTRSATCSRDQVLKLWDLEATQELAAFGGDSPMVGCSIRRGGDDFVAIEATGRIHLLTLHKSTGRRTSN